MISAVRGWKIGFISELAGTIAICVAFFAAYAYPGIWDHFIIYWTRLTIDSAHIIAMFLFALVAYTAVVMLAYFLNRYSTTATLSPINAFGGALLGGAKAFFLFWFILYIALFLPISHSLRSDLRGSFFVPMLTSQGERLDQQIRPATPWFVRPFVIPYLRRHHL